MKTQIEFPFPEQTRIHDIYTHAQNVVDDYNREHNTNIYLEDVDLEYDDYDDSGMDHRVSLEFCDATEGQVEDIIYTIESSGFTSVYCSLLMEIRDIMVGDKLTTCSQIDKYVETVGEAGHDMCYPFSNVLEDVDTELEMYISLKYGFEF